MASPQWPAGAVGGAATPVFCVRGVCNDANWAAAPDYECWADFQKGRATAAACSANAADVAVSGWMQHALAPCLGRDSLTATTPDNNKYSTACRFSVSRKSPSFATDATSRSHQMVERFRT